VLATVIGLMLGLSSRAPVETGKSVATVWLNETARGSVSYCSGDDVSKTQGRSVDDFNQSPSSGTAKAVFNGEFDADADGQRDKYRDALRDGDCDVLYLDVAYMAEFASEGLLYDMTPYLREDEREQKFDEQMMQTVRYDERLWGVPKQLDGGVLFYRADQVRTPPSTWQELFAAAVPSGSEEPPGLRLPLEGYEGLTVVLLELAYAAGADPIVRDEKFANIEQPEVLEVLKTLRDAMRDRAVPQAGTDQLERGTLGVFRIGRARFLRNWVYAEAPIKNVKGDLEDISKRIDIVALPPWKEGRRSTGVLGGHNLVIPVTAKNPSGALHLIRFLTDPEQMRRDAREGSLAPPLRRWRRDQAIKGSAALRALARTTLRPRPLIRQYHEVSAAIHTSVSSLLDWGDASPPSDETIETTLEEMQKAVQDKLK
jgi:ABC-type glycerol-3-phosphate transport system substrate-binding protein